MLSFLYQLIETFHRTHGVHPNVVYMNRLHYRKLLEGLPAMKGQEEVSRFLTMEIVISPEVAHPHVARMHPGGKIYSLAPRPAL